MCGRLASVYTRTYGRPRVWRTAWRSADIALGSGSGQERWHSHVFAQGDRGLDGEQARASLQQARRGRSQRGVPLRPVLPTGHSSATLPLASRAGQPPAGALAVSLPPTAASRGTRHRSEGAAYSSQFAEHCQSASALKLLVVSRWRTDGHRPSRGRQRSARRPRRLRLHPRPPSMGNWGCILHGRDNSVGVPISARESGRQTGHLQFIPGMG